MGCLSLDYEVMDSMTNQQVDGRRRSKVCCKIWEMNSWNPTRLVQPISVEHKGVLLIVNLLYLYSFQHHVLRSLMG